MTRFTLYVRRFTFHLLGVCVSFVIFVASGCTDKAELSIHPDGWADSKSENFHAHKIASSGIEGCKSCHGQSYLGGTSDVSCSSCHAGGRSGHPERGSFLTPGSSEYHGRIFWENGWDFKSCQSCHGNDFDKPESAGGVVEFACSACHTDGIGACNTCHGLWNVSYSGVSYPPKDIQNRSDPTLVSVGAHAAHMESDIAIVACDQCHVVPQHYLDEGHLGSDGIAEVTFDSVATHNGELDPVWNRNAATCYQTYCHGNFTYNNISGNKATPIWINPGSVVCGSCHGIPPTGHFGDYTLEQCSDCHSSVINYEGTIVDRSKHVNGESNF